MIQRAALARLKPYAPKLAGHSVAILLPEPTAERATEAYISAREKAKILQHAGLRVRQLRPRLDSRTEIVGPGELFVVQRPLDLSSLHHQISPRAIDLDSLSFPPFLRPSSATSEVVLRIAAPFLEAHPFALVGAKGTVGREIHTLLSDIGVTVVAVDQGQPLEQLTECRVIISAAGVPGLIKPEHICEEARLLIDVGFVYRPQTDSVLGDVDPAAYGSSAYYTPVPGGVGPLQTLTLLERALVQLSLFEVNPWTIQDAL